MPERSTDKITIDELSIHFDEWQVYRQDNKVEMTKQSLDLLLVLADAWPNTVSQQELMEQVWQGKVVSEQSVKQAIKRLRESLEDLGETYIKVVRGRGYRLDCHKVEVFEKTTPLANKPLWVFALPILLLALCSYLIASNLYAPEIPSPKPDTADVDNQQLSTSKEAYQYYISGLEYYRRYRIEDAKIAINQFNKAIKLDKNFVKAYAALSDAQSLTGDLEDAIITAQYAISLDSNDATAYKALGHAYSLKGWFHKALGTYKKALEIDPNNLAAVSNTGFHFRELGQLDEALFWNLKATKLAPDNAIVYLNIAETLSHLGLKEPALQWFEKVKSVRPDYYHLYYSLTYYYLALGEFEQASQVVSQGQQLLPDNADIMIAAGDVLLVKGEHDKALKLFLQVSDAEDNKKLMHYAGLRAGQIYWLQGEKAKANEILNRALERAQLMLAQGDEWPGNYVDIASIYAIKQSHVESIAWLNRAFDVGWVNYQRLNYDPAFLNMRQHDPFKSLFSKVESKVLAMKVKAEQHIR